MILASIPIPAHAEEGLVELRSELMFQACDDKVCVAPTTIEASVSTLIGEAGEATSEALFNEAMAAQEGTRTGEPPLGESGSIVGSTAPPPSRPLLLTLAFALLGGLLLNAMPCVLPVLSLKVFGIVKAASESRASARTAALILAAYLRWGDACTDHLYGDFAFAIYDPRNETVFCARDRFGSRPFYYHFAAGARFVFASEPRAILVLPQVPFALNEARIADYIVEELEWSDYTSTFFEAIDRLPPAHQLTVSPSGFRMSGVLAGTGRAGAETIVRRRVQGGIPRRIHSRGEGENRRTRRARRDDAERRHGLGFGCLRRARTSSTAQRSAITDLLAHAKRRRRLP